MMDEHQFQIQQKRRLDVGGQIDRSKPIRFSFNGRRMQGYVGDTLASALLANGVDIVGRSFKYSRPRGIMTAGIDEPNAVLQLGGVNKKDDSLHTPNVRATEQPLYEGLVCSSVNGWPSANTDAMSLLGKVGAEVMGPGFYYKTFMFPSSFWMKYEAVIRKAAGLGRSPKVADSESYDHMNHHADVVIVGAGPAGLCAALAAARSGVHVLLVDNHDKAGGELMARGVTTAIDGIPAMDWVAEVVRELKNSSNVTLLFNTLVNGCHDHNFLTAVERRQDHLAPKNRSTDARQRMHKIRASELVLATGAHERPLVFANNDVPGCFTAGAIVSYIKQFAVAPGDKLVVCTNNDSAYEAAMAWNALGQINNEINNESTNASAATVPSLSTGKQVIAIIDSRSKVSGDAYEQAIEAGLTVMTGHVVIEAHGKKRVSGVSVCAVNENATIATGEPQRVACDTIATSGGYSPVVHLASHTGNRPIWDESALGFVPGNTEQAQHVCGSVTGRHALSECLSSGIAAGQAAAKAYVAANATNNAAVDQGVAVPATHEPTVMPTEALYLVPHKLTPTRSPKQFVDFQNDVTAAAIQTAIREGFQNIEHVKRYTALGFGTDQGKTGNINGMAIVAKTLGQRIEDTGTTTFRPNYAPVSFGAVAGAHVGPLFDPKRFTAMHSFHVDHGAVFEDVGQWKRPRYYPIGNETMDQAVRRECKATRDSVGILDASTLGKIDIQGADAREFLGRVYTNAWAKLAPGRCRYGLMCGEDGMVFDDGVTACLNEHHFHMTTTSGGAAGVLNWLEIYHQTDWPELDVFFTSVTDHWATMTVSGPNSRKLLAKVCDDIDLSAEAFKFMDWTSGTVAGVPARVFRISFTGELSYEINVPAHYGADVWNALFDAGKEFNLTPYGTETMHVLRADKGFIIVGQDTDGSVTPIDLDHGWAVNNNKPFSFIGKRGMAREDCVRENRKQLVGLKTKNPDVILPEGAQAVELGVELEEPVPMIGHVTSSYYSMALDRSIALALIKGGIDRYGEVIAFPLLDNRIVHAEICSPVFYDPNNDAQKG